MPEISIIVPCYNQSQYLDECLQSVLDQTYTDWECIIVNDGSPDNTEDVAKKWTEKDSRFKYLKKENGGLSSARNAGIRIARGEWILPLDSDDKIDKYYLELAEKEFNKNYTIIYCNARKFGIVDLDWDVPEFSLANLAKQNVIFCSAFFKRKSWSNISGYDINMIYGLEDWEFWISLVKTGGKVYKIPEICFFYRVKENSMLRSIDRNRFKKMYNYVALKHTSFFIEHLGNFHNLYQDKLKLEKELKAIYSSKKYRFISKLFYPIEWIINRL